MPSHYIPPVWELDEVSPNAVVRSTINISKDGDVTLVRIINNNEFTTNQLERIISAINNSKFKPRVMKGEKMEFKNINMAYCANTKYSKPHRGGNVSCSTK